MVSVGSEMYLALPKGIDRRVSACRPACVPLLAAGLYGLKRRKKRWLKVGLEYLRQTFGNVVRCSQSEKKKETLAGEWVLS